MFEGFYLAMLIVPVAIGFILPVLSLDVRVKDMSLILCVISCIAGVLAFPMHMVVGDISYIFPIPSAWGDHALLIDELSSIMITFSSAVFMMIVIHMFRSASAPADGKYYAMVCALFVSCIIAMCADSVLLILMAWEMVTLLTFLMSFRGDDRRSGRTFFIIAHLGGLLVISSFLIMYVFAGTGTLSQWASLSSIMGTKLSCIAIAMLFVGFGTKLGLVPFHAWMPDMYAESPTHTTALLSTVCTNVAILILFKGVFGFIGVTADMHLIAIILIAVASVTAIWGALESLIQTEPRRILAYSSMENMGIVVLSFSLAMLFTESGSTGLMTMALIAALLHTINHSVFKALMTLSVCTVEDSTGTTVMNRMGGLALTLPLLSVVSLIAILSMAAIPPFSGFMSEWMMLQSLISGDMTGIGALEMVLPICVAVLGVSGMMAAVSYARMYSFMFLGRPKSEEAATPKKAERMGLTSMAILAILCAALGLMAVPVMDALASGIYATAGFSLTDPYQDHMTSSFNLPLIAGAIVIVAVLIYGLDKMFKKKTITARTWDCGTDLESNMQYSSIGFTQPLVRVFHPLYGDAMEVKEEENSPKQYTVMFKEPFVKYIYEPVERFVMFLSRSVRRMQNGSIQTYLGYVLITLVAVLVAVRFI